MCVHWPLQWRLQSHNGTRQGGRWQQVRAGAPLQSGEKVGKTDTSWESLSCLSPRVIMDKKSSLLPPALSLPLAPAPARPLSNHFSPGNIQIVQPALTVHQAEGFLKFPGYNTWVFTLRISEFVVPSCVPSDGRNAMYVRWLMSVTWARDVGALLPGPGGSPGMEDLGTSTFLRMMWTKKSSWLAFIIKGTSCSSFCKFSSKLFSVLCSCYYISLYTRTICRIWREKYIYVESGFCLSSPTIIKYTF